MVIVLKQGVTEQQRLELTEQLEKTGVKVSTIVGKGTTILGLVGDTYNLDMETIKAIDIVERVMKVQEPFKLTNRKFHPENTVIDVGGVKIGGEKLVVMAGPCSVESKTQLMGVAEEVSKHGADILRGGAFKPRTSPYAFQGLRSEGLLLLKQASQKTKMPIISEITNPFFIEMFVDSVDILQVGARNMQNFELLKELGHIRKPVMLKRGFANTVEEFLMSAEYIMSGGNKNVILCERGIRTFESFTRNTLDISAVPALKAQSHLPVIVDPSHAAGIYWMVEPLSLAAVAAGADGLMIEVHSDPKLAASDGAQSLVPDAFGALMKKIAPVAEAVGRKL
jgi:3-deoxy-7-phosphoheptulonate synthase